MSDKSMMFELWTECNSRCKFCAIPGTKILMADYSLKKIEDIKSGDFVMGAVSGKSKFNLIPTKVINTANRYYEGKLYGKFTDNHPILATRPSRKLYVPAKNSQSQVCPITPKISIPQTDMYKLGYIIGCFRGDGSYKTYITKEHTYNVRKRICKNGKRVYVEGETEIAHYYPHSIYKLRFFVKDLDITYRLKEYLDCFNSYFYIKSCTITKITREAIFANTEEAYNWLINIIDKNLLKNTNLDYCKGFLAGIYDCEGSFSGGILRIGQNEGDTLNEIIRCINLLKYKYRYEDYEKCKTIRILGEDTLKFIEDICPACKRKLYGRKTTSFYIRKGRLPISEYKGLVYNFETETNNYVADGIVVHNCYLGKNNQGTPDSEKLHNISKVSNIIKDTFTEELEQYKAAGFIGGEFFQGQMRNPEVKTAFFALCKQVFDLIEKDKIRDFWCYATLTIGDQKDLYELIELFNQTVTDKEKHHFWVLVSYDTWGRFHTDKMKNNWETHMLNLQKYPFIRFNVTSILSQDFCEKVLSGEHNLTEFRKKFNISSFFFKQPTKTHDYNSKEEFAAVYPGWFLKRKTFIKFLEKIKAEDPALFDNVLNIVQRADDILQSGNDYKGQHRNKITWEESDMDVNPKCGHVLPYQCYVDSDACCLCDYFKVKGE